MQPPPVRDTPPSAPPAAGPREARLEVVLPENSLLWIDGINHPGPGTLRSFQTPPIAVDSKYMVSVSTWDGFTYRWGGAKNVIVRPGETTRVDFTPAAQRSQPIETQPGYYAPGYYVPVYYRPVYYRPVYAGGVGGVGAVCVLGDG